MNGLRFSTQIKGNRRNVLKRIKFYLFFAVFLSVQNVALSEPATVVKQKIKFLPITISLACTNETPLFDRVQSTRASGATPEVKQVECTDKRNSIKDVQPTLVGVAFNEKINSWFVIIDFSDKDAKDIQAWSVSRVGRRFLIISDGKAVSSANLNGPFVGERLYMSADSRISAHNVSMLFVEPKSRW